MLRSGTHKPCSAEEISRTLYIAEPAAEDQLARLCADGLLVRRDDAHGKSWYYYEPMTAELAEQVDALALDYAQRRVRVIEEIYSGPSSTVRSFAGAFKFRDRSGK